MKIKTAVIWVAFLTLVSNLLGFARETGIAYVFGASRESDAYYLSAILPDIIAAWISTALTAAVLPLYTEYLAEGRDKARTFAQTVLFIVTLLLLLFTVTTFCTGEQMMRWIAPGFEEAGIQLAYGLYLFTSPAILFLGLLGVVTALLNAHNRFLSSASSGIVHNGVLLIGILVVLYTHNVYHLAAFFTLGMTARFLIQLPALRQVGLLHRPWTIDLQHPGLRRMLAMIAPIMLGMLAGQINFLVDRILASGLIEGSISALNYANKVVGIPQQLFAASIATVLFPRLAESAVKREEERFLDQIQRSLMFLMYALLPVSVLLFLMRKQVVHLLFEHGAFDMNATALTASLLGAFAWGLPFLSATVLLVRAFNARLETKLSARIGVLSAIVNIALSLLLVRPLESMGLAASNAIAFAVNALLLWLILRVQVGKTLTASGQQALLRRTDRQMLRETMYMLLSGVVMAAVVVLWMAKVQAPQGFVTLAVWMCGGGAFGLCAYLVVSVILRSQNAEEIVKVMKRFVPKKGGLS